MSESRVWIVVVCSRRVLPGWHSIHVSPTASHTAHSLCFLVLCSVQALARAYSTVYHKQTQADFWGLREFYSTVKHINRTLAKDNSRTLDGQLVCIGFTSRFRPTLLFVPPPNL